MGRRWGVSRPVGPVRGRRRWVGTRVPRLRPSECPPRRLHPLLRLCCERLIVVRPAQLGEPLLRRRPVRVGVDWSRPPRRGLGLTQALENGLAMVDDRGKSPLSYQAVPVNTVMERAPPAGTVVSSAR